MTAPEPLIDIVVLVHDVPDWADLCVRSVESHTKHPFRLIIVDNASVEPKTHALFKEWQARGHTVLHLAENRSFSNGVNAGVNAGTSKFIVILNDDAIVTEGWDSALVQDAGEKSVGLAGARSNFAAGPQGNPSFIGDPPLLVFVCVALRREVWDKVGPLDEITFDGFSSEDLDYSWRVLTAGFKLKVSNAFVLHAGSRTLVKTNSSGGAQQVAQALQKNNEKYNARLAEKWGKEWVAEHTKLQQKGLIATFHAEEHTRVTFMGNLMSLKRSDGVGFHYYHHTRSPIHVARQLVCDYATDNGYDWLVMLDDDATFPSDLLRRLLAHQKEVVCALAYQRKEPYLSCAYELVDPVGVHGSPLENIEHTGLRKVDVSGFHCSMIKTSIIKKLRAGVKDKDGKELVPGTRAYFGGFENKLGEDFAFCANLRKIGVPIYCDTELIAGHIGSAVVVDEAYKKAHKEGRAP